MNSTLWQHPYVNLLKQFKVSTWKKVTKGGEVTTKSDKKLRGTVVEIRGTVPASNFIQLPGLSSQNLNLTGRYFYILFRPIPSRHFVFHLDVVTSEGVSLRLSFSNLYRQTKFSSTALQFPLFSPNDDLPEPVRWTMMMVDLSELVSRHAGRRYSHVRGVQLCANLKVRSVLTSDLQYWPADLGPRPTGFVALPREVAFPTLTGGELWKERYRFIRLPPLEELIPTPALRPPEVASARSKEVHSLRGVSGPELSAIERITAPAPAATAGLANAPLRLPPRSLPTADDLPLVSTAAESEVVIDAMPRTLPKSISQPAAPEEVHVLAAPLPPPSTTPPAKKDLLKKENEKPALKPEPIMQLSLVLGVSPQWRHLLVAPRDGGAEVVFACHALVIAMDTGTLHQRHFVGHPGPVSALALDDTSQWLASACGGLVRLWDFREARCLAVAKASVRHVALLALAPAPAVLVAAGRDEQGRQAVSVWRVDDERLVLMARANVEAEVRQMRVLPPMSSTATGTHRLVSVGRNNVRLWRLKAGLLRSSPVDLGEYAGAQIDFVDCSFDPAWRHSLGGENEEERPLTVFACASSGHVFCIDAAKFRLMAVRQLLPTAESPMLGPGVALTSLAVAPDEAFVATVSRDGYLRLWPCDFSRGVLLEAEHEAPLTAVAIGDDGRCVYALTASGCLGRLSLTTRNYVTLSRALTESVTSAAFESSKRLLATGSVGGVRVWRLEDDARNGASLLCVYVPPSGALPTALTFLPGSTSRLLCATDGGCLRLLDVAGATATAPPEQRLHRGAIVAALFSPGGHRLITCDSFGTLSLLDATSGPPFRVRRLLEAAVVKSEAPYANVASLVALDTNGNQLAYIGPSRAVVTLADAHSLAAVLRVDLAMIEAEAGLHEPSSGAAKLAFSPNERHLLVSTRSGLLLRLAANDGALLGSKRCSAASGLALSPASGRFVVACANNGVLTVTDAAMQARSQRFLGHHNGVSHLIFAVDGSTLISVGDTVLVWRFLGDPRPPPPPPVAIVELSEDEREEEEEVEVAPEPEPPLAMAHYVERPNSVDNEEEDMAQRRYLAPPAHCAISLCGAIGYRGSGGQSLVWDGASGLMAYTCGRSVVVEDLATSSGGGTRQRHLMAPEARSVSALALSADGRHLAVAGVGASGQPAQLCVWDVGRLGEVDDAEAALVQLRLCHHGGGAIQALVFSPDNSHLVSVGNFVDSALLLWDAATWEVIGRAALPCAQHALAWDPNDANAFVTAGQGGSILCWRFSENVSTALELSERLESPLEMMTDGGASFEITCLTFWAPDVFLVGANNGRVSLWRSGNCLLHWLADRGELGFLTTLRAPAQPPQLVSGGASGSLKLWDLTRLPMVEEAVLTSVPTVVLAREVELNARLTAIAATDPAGELCVVGASDGAVWMVDWRHKEEAPTQLVPAVGRPVALDWAAAPAGWLACACDGGCVLVLDGLASREAVCRIEVGSAKATCVAFAPGPVNGSACCDLSVGFQDGSVRHFDLQAVQLREKWTPLGSAVTALSFAPSGTVLLAGGHDGTVALLALNGGVLKLLRDHRGAPITSLDVRAERWLAASSDSRVSVWRSDWTGFTCELHDWISFGTGKEEAQNSNVCLAVFSEQRTAREILFYGPCQEPKLQVYCLSARRVVRTIDLCEAPQVMALCPTEPFLALGSRRWLLKLVDLCSGSFQDFVQHGAGVKAVRFSRDGRFLATAARGEILLWEVRQPDDQ